VEIALAGEQSLAQQYFRALQNAAFDEITMSIHQDILNEVRPVQQIDVLLTQVDVCDVAIVTRYVEQELCRPATELKEGSDYWTALRTRRSAERLGGNHRCITSVRSG
jgi:hypothetical protein